MVLSAILASREALEAAGLSGVAALDEKRYSADGHAWTRTSANVTVLARGEGDMA